MVSRCCWKVGLKKGPWAPEEDKILINYIKKYGHENWRALPRYAGLLRCGKSCRLRWTNYLRPDIKRGNFTKEEEDTIIELHGKMGNKWSAIAAKLPGRTDNEIKNVWHTRLKKRVPPENGTNNNTEDKPTSSSAVNNSDNIITNQTTQTCTEEPENINGNTTTSPPPGLETPTSTLISSPQPTCSEISSVTTDSVTSGSKISDNISIINSGILDRQTNNGLDYFPEFDGSFWCDSPFDHGFNSAFDISDCITEITGHTYAYSSNSTNTNDSLDLWNTCENLVFADGFDLWCD